MSDLSVLANATNWRKSSRSQGGNGGCVEVAYAGGAFGVRDTKDRAGGTLAFGAAAWKGFLANVRLGSFDL